MIIDDEREICKALRGILSDEGYRVLIAHTPEEATGIIASENPHLLLLDVWFGKGSWDGVYFLDRLQLSHPFIPIIMISGHATLSLAVSALQKGAYDFLEKPINVDRLLLSVKHALAFKHIQSRLVTHREGAPWEWPLPIDARLKKAAASDVRILLLGERGVGKTRLAKFLHLLSPRHEGPVVVAGSVMLNAMDDASFFGVQSLGRIQKFGFFEQVQGGTVILSNVHRLSPSRQATLAQLFESNSIKRIGGDQAIPLNLRFIATALPHFMQSSDGTTSEAKMPLMPKTLEATPQRLEAVDRSFYHRITLTSFRLDALRENMSLVPLWTNALLQELAQDHDIPVPNISEGALMHLKSLPWKGNMHQLLNVLQRIVIDHKPTLIDVHHLPQELMAQEGHGLIHSLSLPNNIYALPLKEARACFEISYVRAQLAASEGSVTRAAEVIGMERSALHRKLKTLSSRSQAPPV